MITVNASTLEEAYTKASKEFGCSIVELDIAVVQNPSKGFLGMFAKEAIVEVEHKDDKKRVKVATKKESINSDENDISSKISQGITNLLGASCYNLELIKVEVEDGVAHIFIDGEDAALMIGKEGYRYKSLSYILHNWIKIKYKLAISLEIAQFLENQKDGMKNYLVSVKEKVIANGRAQTKPLDGILVKIALEDLRAEYPNMYVAMKSLRDGRKIVVVNQSRNRKKQ